MPFHLNHNLGLITGGKKVYLFLVIVDKHLNMKLYTMLQHCHPALYKQGNHKTE